MQIPKLTHGLHSSNLIFKPILKIHKVMDRGLLENVRRVDEIWQFSLERGFGFKEKHSYEIANPPCMLSCVIS
jgi:hypothetical protein